MRAFCIDYLGLPLYFLGIIFLAINQGNQAYRDKQWQKAIGFYTDTIKLRDEGNIKLGFLLQLLYYFYDVYDFGPLFCESFFSIGNLYLKIPLSL